MHILRFTDGLDFLHASGKMSLIDFLLESLSTKTGTGSKRPLPVKTVAVNSMVDIFTPGGGKGPFIIVMAPIGKFWLKTEQPGEITNIDFCSTGCSTDNFLQMLLLYQ